jgi:dipeptidyl-peptidase 4
MSRVEPCLAVLLLAALPLAAQESRDVSVEWAYSDEAEAVSKPPRYAWTSEGDVLLLDEGKPKSERTIERWRAATGTRLDTVKRAAALGSLASLLPESDRPETLTWPDSTDRAGRIGLYVFGGDVFALDLAASRFRRLTQTPETESAARLSPDGRKAAYVRAGDLYVFDLASGMETRLTHDGGKGVLNGALSWVYWEEVFDHDEAGYWWSDDSSAIAFLRTDESAVDRVTFSDFRPALPKLLEQRYPKAGDANPSVRLGILEVASGRTVWMESSDAPYEYVLGVKWLPNGGRLAVQLTNRDQNRLDLVLVERSSGKTTRVLSDDDPAWVDQKEIQFLDGGRALLVSSERDGHTHLYRYTSTGALVNPVTRGDWSVRGPGAFYGAPLGSAFVDERRGIVYFTALEKSPVERHLYRVRLDGSRMQRITREDGTHRIAFSPDRRFYLDLYSAKNTPPSLTLHDAAGVERAVLVPRRDEPLARLRFQPAEIFTVPAADGFPLPARIVKPEAFDPAHKYPVIVYVYGGPGAPTVNDSWDYSFANNVYFDQVLIRRGYVVFSVDNRSATGRSKTLENLTVRRMMSDEELNDLLAGIRWLKAQSWADPDRVGIWGWSGGGSSTLLALTRSKEFKAGVAVAPVTDWHYYDTKFTETYMKTPAENPDGYAQTSHVARAKDLHGRLMLVFGTYDDNVHPQNSQAFIDELVKARIPFDLMIYPMRKHTIEDRPARIHLFDKMLEFWKRNL